MFVALVVIVLLIAAVAAIYLLLKNMGQDGVEIAAPGSCKSGTCGVRKGGAETCCAQDEDPSAEVAAIKPPEALPSGEGLKVIPPPGGRP